MNDMTPTKIASLFTGLDILARAQFMEGFSGATPPNSALRGKTGAVALLAKIKELAEEISPNISPAWWDKQESGLYRPVYKLADRMGASQGIDAHDVMNEELANEKGSIFYASGRMARVGSKANGIKTGELGPSDLQGIIKNLAIKSVKEALDEIVRHRTLENEQAALLTETTTGVGGLDQTEWSMVTDAILAQPNHPISKEFFAWLKGITDRMTGAESRLMGQYLDLILSGQASSETEAGEILGLPNLGYLGTVKRKFMDMAAQMLGDNKGRAPGVQRIKDLLSDASFLNQLLKGRVPGSRTAKLLAKVQKLASTKRASQQSRLLSAHDYEGMLTTAKFPAGKSMTVDEVAKVVGPEFKEMNENPPESVKKVMEEMKKSATRPLLATDAFAEMLRDSKFEKGKPADPTENMSPEDAAEWERQTEENKDNFKSAGTGRVAGNGYVADAISEAVTKLRLAQGGLHYRLYGDDILFQHGTPEFAIAAKANDTILECTKKLSQVYRELDRVDLQFTGRETTFRGASDKTAAAASGLYGFTKSAEKSCVGAAGKLAKYATKLAKDLYTADADTAPFLEEHAKRGFKTATMLRNAMADVGPGPAPKTKTASSKSGNGLYGFKDRTAKLAMEACSNLHQAAGHLAADLAAKFGEKQGDGAAFLKKHAKAAKCAHSDLILDSYPSAPVKVAEKPPVASKAPAGKKAFVDPTVDEILAWDRAVANRMATSFLAAEDDLMAEDLISEWDAEVMAGRPWGGPNYRPKPVDDSIPYNSHPESPPAGANGSAERRRYNKWFRENVCPDHATNCGL